MEQGYTRAVVLDISKYFDTINHVKLLNLLRQNVKDERVARSGELSFQTALLF